MLPLEGIRVLDLAIMFAGPGAAMYLGDMGAEVIKVEQHKGDDSRLNTTPFLGEHSRGFMVLNRNKRGIVIDLQASDGQEVLHRLVRSTDVLIHNYRPGVAERLGAGYDALSALNPRLIYVWSSAFGSTGPLASVGAYDNVTLGYSGITHVRIDRDGEPSGTGTYISDTGLPMLVGFAVGAALWAREETGRGQLIDTSLLNVAIAAQAPHWVRTGEKELAGYDPIERACPVLQCGDGDWVTVAVVADQEWEAFCKALGDEKLRIDPRFVSLDGRAKHRDELIGFLAPIFRTRPAEELVTLLQAAGVPCVPVLARQALPRAEHVVSNEALTDVQHPAAGLTRMMAVPVTLWDTPGSVRRASPGKGEHTDDILHELDYSPGEIASLRSQGVVG